MERKRPRGLKKSAESGTGQKKRKPTEAVEDVPAASGSQNTEGAPSKDMRTIVVDASSDGDDVAIIKKLYEMAMEKIDDEATLEEAKDFLNGTVHECDRLLRLAHEDEESKSFPAEFFLHYGLALKRLGEAQEDESDRQAFEEASEERLLQALDSEELDAESVKWRILQALAELNLRKAMVLYQDNPSDKDASALLELATQQLSEYSGLLVEEKQVSDEDKETLLVNMGFAVQRVADMCDDIKAKEKGCRGAEHVFRLAIKVNKGSIEGHMGLGSCSLSLASYFLDQADEDHESAKNNKIAEKKLKAALAEFRQGQQAAKDQSTEKPAVLCMLGETLINLGNLYDDDDEEAASEFYKEAFQCFKQVQEIDANALPEQFIEFVEEWENDMDS
ncbi:nuclear pore complex subunit Nro1-domain-containing protein [Polychytrium aggregatum]|uniref:nuclear pore complex subunit Nro1-domain-containing protein n=1 Tax=Polychytrium aggregatum TaxID=110093 RepID=UPI0022FEAA73|nr:nuclear pore complex subunit Nro1-domain-containing protein [Polychytrium aggregatum]KAI9206858.1 nuclear pore complex subunit Nro1-domain-containing protein [Polychytrium aggregatum]